LEPVVGLVRRIGQPFNWLREEGRRADLARGASAAFLIRLGGMGAAFLVQILIARVAGVSGFGEYTYVLSWVLLLSLFARIGLDSASLRFVAGYSATSDWARLRGFVVQSHRLTFLVSVLVSAVVAVLVSILRDRLSPTLSVTAWIGCVALPVLCLLHLESASLRGLRVVVASLVPTELIRPIALGVVVVLWYWTAGAPLNAPNAMSAHLVGIALALLATAAAMRRHLPFEVSEVRSTMQTREWVRVALPLLLLSGMQMVMGQADVLMIGALLGTDQAGIYAAASRLAQLLPFGLIAVNTVIAPTIAELWVQNRRDQLQRVLTVAARATAVATVGLALLLAPLGRFALGLFGPDFAAGHAALMILIAGQLTLAVSGSVGFVMTMTGLEGKAAFIAVMVASLNVVLNALLIPVFGLVGAALATACTVVIWNGAMLLTVARHRRLNASVFSGRPEPSPSH
jgi:O-antigen/teichoic acid export membrane protein